MNRPLTIVLIFLVGLVLLGGCARQPSPSPAKANLKTNLAKKNAETGALKTLEKVPPKTPDSAGIVVMTPPGDISQKIPQQADPLTSPPGATAQNTKTGRDAMVSVGQSQSLRRPGSKPIVTFRVRSSLPYLNEADAEEDALLIARDKIEQKLADLDPPLKYSPTVNEVRHEFARRDSRNARTPNVDEREILKNSGIGEGRTYVEYDIEVTADQIRDLRTRDRVTLAMRMVGAMTIVALASFLFLRADEYTKGYLTRWLAFAAFALAGGVAAALYFV